MAKDDILTNEEDISEVSEEALDKLNGGAGLRCGFPNKRIRKPKNPDEPKDGGATVSW